MRRTRWPTTRGTWRNPAAGTTPSAWSWPGGWPCLICAPLLKNNAGKVQELESLYRAALPDAMQSDASEREERAEPDAGCWQEEDLTDDP